ncbi:hypothetical protein [Lichenihabitans psoromatis]|uniref:hypothetical protein n=1 Tax=Lichenihabitans psoromatis TaxID=2528642 RepID=UPI0010384BB6|nr:hypothetical protein [Lichenihabitans psoromatis]
MDQPRFAMRTFITVMKLTSGGVVESNCEGGNMLKQAMIYTGLVVALAQPAYAEISKYNITDAEKAACHDDVMAFCSEAFPDEDRILACMKLNKANLTTSCRTVFNAGMTRRHLD